VSTAGVKSVSLVNESISIEKVVIGKYRNSVHGSAHTTTNGSIIDSFEFVSINANRNRDIVNNWVVEHSGRRAGYGGGV